MLPGTWEHAGPIVKLALHMVYFLSTDMLNLSNNETVDDQNTDRALEHFAGQGFAAFKEPVIPVLNYR